MGLQKCDKFRQYSVDGRLQRFMFENDNDNPRRKKKSPQAKQLPLA